MFHSISGYFRQYDYGFINNFIKYQQFAPPDYDLSKVTAPGYLFHAKNDWVCSTIDVERLYSELSNVLGKFLIPKPMFNHLDFVFGSSAPELVYRNVLKVLSKH